MHRTTKKQKGLMLPTTEKLSGRTHLTTEKYCQSQTPSTDCVLCSVWADLSRAKPSGIWVCPSGISAPILHEIQLKDWSSHRGVEKWQKNIANFHLQTMSFSLDKKKLTVNFEFSAQFKIKVGQNVFRMTITHFVQYTVDNRLYTIDNRHF